MIETFRMAVKIAQDSIALPISAHARVIWYLREGVVCGLRETNLTNMNVNNREIVLRDRYFPFRSRPCQICNACFAHGLSPFP